MVSVNRRSVLEALAPATTALSAGCLFDGGTPRTRCGHPARKLDIAFTTEQSARGWQLNGTVHNRGLEEPFRNVTVHVYSNQEELLCEQDVGTVAGGSVTNFTVDCGGFPDVVTASASEGPCEPCVKIPILVYRETTGDRTWDATRTRACGEGLPPEVDP